MYIDIVETRGLYLQRYSKNSYFNSLIKWKSH